MLICIGKGKVDADDANFLLFVLQVSNGSSYPQMLSIFRAALFTVYSLCVSIFYILHIIFLKNLFKALFQQHQHFVTIYIPFTTIHLCFKYRSLRLLLSLPLPLHLRSDMSSAKSPCGWRQRAKRHWHTMRQSGSMKRAQIPAMM